MLKMLPIRHFAGLALAALSAAAAVAGPADGTWGLASPPAGRFGHASAYDPVRDRMLVFGGTVSFSGAGTVNAEVLSLDLSGTDPAWTPIATAGTPPPGRYGHTMVYDPVRDRMLVFGGYTNAIFKQDVWALSLAGTPTWTQLTPSGTPPVVRYGHVAAYDPNGDRMMMFGGAGNAGALYNDVWQLSLSGTPTWTPLTPSGSPPLSRRAASVILDTNRQRLVIFGGFRGTYLADVWELPLTGTLAWTPVVTSGVAPSGRAFHSATYDVGRDEMVVFGGSDGSNKSDAFALSFTGPATWSAIATPGGDPGARGWHTLIRDPLRDRDIAFSGVSSIVLADLWKLTRDGTPAWTPMPASCPYLFGSRSSASMIRDPVRDRLIVFGGVNGATIYGDLWEWPLSPGQSARPLVATGTPPTPRTAASAIYDPVRDRMVLFGGSAAGGVVGDVWELTLSGTPAWNQLSPAGAPSLVRSRHSAVYDATSDAMLVFGGIDGVDWRADTWRLSLGSTMTWTDISPIAPGPKPASRYSHVAVLDPVTRRMYVFGGDPPDLQTWRLELSGAPSWSVEPTSGPVSRIGATAIYDAARHRGVMFGGNTGSSYGNEAWELKFSPGGATWNALAPDGLLPPGRYNAASAYDVMRNRMLVFGGLAGTTALNDLQALQWQGALGVDPTAGPSRLSLAPPWPNPSSAGVAIPFTMPTTGHARVRLYDVHGRFVRELLNGPVAAGPQSLRWDRRTAAGEMSRAGVYFVELKAAGERRTQRFVATD